MTYAFIKDTICVNIAVFESEEKAFAFKDILIRDNIIDNIVLLDKEFQFGIGDKYEDGKWTKQEPDEIPKGSTAEDYLVELDFRVSKIELGLEV